MVSIMRGNRTKKSQLPALLERLLLAWLYARTNKYEGKRVNVAKFSCKILQI